MVGHDATWGVWGPGGTRHGRAREREVGGDGRTWYRSRATRASGGMADALASGASEGNLVGVQVPPRPPRSPCYRQGLRVVVGADLRALMIWKHWAEATTCRMAPPRRLAVLARRAGLERQLATALRPSDGTTTVDGRGPRRRSRGRRGSAPRASACGVLGARHGAAVERDRSSATSRLRLADGHDAADLGDGLDDPEPAGLEATSRQRRPSASPRRMPVVASTTQSVWSRSLDGLRLLPGTSEASLHPTRGCSSDFRPARGGSAASAGLRASRPHRTASLKARCRRLGAPPRHRPVTCGYGGELAAVLSVLDIERRAHASPAVAGPGSRDVTAWRAMARCPHCVS